MNAVYKPVFDINAHAEWIRQETLTILHDARSHVTPAVTHPDCMANLPPTPFTFNYAPNWWDWSTKNVYYINNGPAPAEKSDKDREQDAAKRAVAIGAIISWIGSFVLGYTLSRFHTHLNQMNYSANMIQNNQGDLFEALPVFRDLISKRHEIDQANYFNTRNQLASVAVILAGGASLVIGGLKVSATIMSIGYVLALAGACGFLLNLGLHWNDKADNQRRYLNITGYEYTTPGSTQKVTGLADAVLNALQEILQKKACAENPAPYAPPQSESAYESVYPTLPKRTKLEPSAPPL